MNVIKTIRKKDIPQAGNTLYAEANRKLIRALHGCTGDEGLQLHITKYADISRLRTLIRNKFTIKQWKISERKRADGSGWDLYIFPKDERTL